MASLGLLGALNGLGEGMKSAGSLLFSDALMTKREERLQAIRDREYARNRADTVSDIRDDRSFRSDEARKQRESIAEEGRLQREFTGEQGRLARELTASEGLADREARADLTGWTVETVMGPGFSEALYAVNAREGDVRPLTKEGIDGIDLSGYGPLDEAAIKEVMRLNPGVSLKQAREYLEKKNRLGGFTD